MDCSRQSDHRNVPFQLSKDFFFVSESRRQVIAEICSRISASSSFVVVQSSGGCGLTTLLRHLSNARGVGSLATEFILTTASDEEVNAFDAFSLAMGTQNQTHAERVLAEFAVSGIHLIWMIDDDVILDQADVLKVAQAYPSLTIVMGMRGSFPAIGSRSPAIFLAPLTLAETESFLKQSLRLAGWREPPFSNEAMKQIHRVSGGRIKRICESLQQVMRRTPHGDRQFFRRAA